MNLYTANKIYRKGSRIRVKSHESSFFSEPFIIREIDVGHSIYLRREAVYIFVENRNFPSNNFFYDYEVEVL